METLRYFVSTWLKFLVSRPNNAKISVKYSFLQALLPLLTVLPGVGVMAAVSAQADSTVVDSILFSYIFALAWNPVMDAFITIMFVRPFRRAVIAAIPGLKSSNRIISVVQMSIQQTDHHS